MERRARARELAGAGISGHASREAPKPAPRREAAMGIAHRKVEANGIGIHIAEAGTGPLVLLCHGWPESWYSWRGQLLALAEAGYRAVAPDMRGYGETDAP